jgi:hypothetical protein
MKQFVCAIVVSLAITGAALAEHYFAVITAVNADKGTVDYKIVFGKQKGTEVKAKLAKDCVIREGVYRLGKPATLKEGDVLVNGLRNFVFEKVSPDNPLRVDIYTADTADADKGINEGDILKILVNPKK